MTSRICVCCGERFSVEINTLSRNSNICASCSSMADGMDEPNLPDAVALRSSQTPAGQPRPSEIGVASEVDKGTEKATQQAF